MFKLDKPLYFFLLWVAIVLLIRIIGQFTPFADEAFPGVHLFFSKIIIAFSGIFPFSLGDVFYTVLGCLLLYWVIQVFIQIKNKNWVGFKKKISVFLIGLGLFTLIFHLFWGFNYYKTPIQESYSNENINADELKRLAEFYLKESIESRRSLPENPDGIFEIRISKKEMGEEILKISPELTKMKELQLNGFTRPNLKTSLYSTVFSYMGVLGYYNPFTAEAQYNSKMPDTKLIFTQFHETAHQWGAAPESEANFIGFLIGTKSENKAFNYVSNYKALRSLLGKIFWEDREFVKSILENYSSAMERDRQFEIEIEKKYLHKAEDAFSMMNDAYLQLNNQEGVSSYGRFVELLVGYHRKYNPI